VTNKGGKKDTGPGWNLIKSRTAFDNGGPLKSKEATEENDQKGGVSGRGKREGLKNTPRSRKTWGNSGSSPTTKLGRSIVCNLGTRDAKSGL